MATAARAENAAPMVMILSGLCQTLHCYWDLNPGHNGAIATYLAGVLPSSLVDEYNIGPSSEGLSVAEDIVKSLRL